MKNISLNIDKVTGFVTREQILALEPQVKRAQAALEEGTLPGNDFLGWLHLPSSITKEQIADINATAQTLRENCEVVVVAGIGGSYLGARAVIEALSNNFAALIKKILDGGKSFYDSLIAGDHTIFERYVKVAANEDFFAGKIDVFDCFLVVVHWLTPILFYNFTL